MAEALGKPADHHGIGNRGQSTAAHGLNTAIPHGGIADLGCGVAEDQGRKALGIEQRETLPNHPTDRNARQRQPLDIEVIQQTGKVVDMLIQRIVACGSIAQAMPALVIGDDAIAIGEQRDNCVPNERISAQRIHEDECGCGHGTG
jgi:hypothetical protein